METSLKTCIFRPADILYYTILTVIEIYHKYGEHFTQANISSSIIVWFQYVVYLLFVNWKKVSGKCYD